MKQFCVSNRQKTMKKASSQRSLLSKKLDFYLRAAIFFQVN